MPPAPPEDLCSWSVKLSGHENGVAKSLRPTADPSVKIRAAQIESAPVAAKLRAMLVQWSRAIGTGGRGILSRWLLDRGVRARSFWFFRRTWEHHRKLV